MRADDGIEHAAEHSDADRGTDLQRGIDNAADQASVARFHTLDDSSHHGRHGYAHAEPDDRDRRAQQSPRRNGASGEMGRDQRGRDSTGRRQRKAERRRCPSQPAAGQRADCRSGQEADGEGNDPEPGLQGAEAERALQIDRIDQEERGNGVERHDGAEAAHQAALLKDLERDERIAARLGQPNFVASEPFDKDRRSQQHDDRPQWPAALPPVDQRQDESRERRAG